jgi:hypothetical protein
MAADPVQPTYRLYTNNRYACSIPIRHAVINYGSRGKERPDTSLSTAPSSCFVRTVSGVTGFNNWLTSTASFPHTHTMTRSDALDSTQTVQFAEQSGRTFRKEGSTFWSCVECGAKMMKCNDGGGMPDESPGHALELASS